MYDNENLKNNKNTDIQENEFQALLNNSNSNYTDKDTKNSRFNLNNINIYIVLTIVVISIISLFFLSDSIHKIYIDGNVLRIPLVSAVQSDIQYVGNPWKNSSISAQLLFRNLFSTDSELTQINPDLCSGYTVSSDELSYTITLKDNLNWSDGTQITVDDIIFSVEAFMQCTDANTSIKTAFNTIVGVDDFLSGKTENISGILVNGLDITFKLNQKHNNFMIMLTQFPPLPKHILEFEDLSTLTSNHIFFTNENPVCSGMYLSTGLDEHCNLVYSKNPYYEDVEPKIDEVILYWDYINTDIDLHHTTDFTEIVSYRAIKGFQEYLVDVYFYRYFVCNLGNANKEHNDVMQDIRIRKAIYHAIDIPTLLSEVYYDAGTLIYSGSIQFNDTEIYEYNPIKARELLKEADYDFERPITIMYYYRDATSVVFLQKIAQYLETIGLKVDLINTTDNDDLYVYCDYDIMFKGLSSVNTNDWYYEYLSTNDDMNNIFNTTKFDKLIYQLNSVSNSKELESTLKSLIELEQELLYKIPMFTLNQAVYVNTNRLKIPEDMTFGDIMYSSDLRIDEWEIKNR